MSEPDLREAVERLFSLFGIALHHHDLDHPDVAFELCNIEQRAKELFACAATQPTKREAELAERVKELETLCADANQMATHNAHEVEKRNSDKARLQEQLAAVTNERDEAKREALGLANSIWRQFYMKEAPQWEPLSEPAGIISQIDNMVAGIRDDLVVSRNQLLASEAQREQMRRILLAALQEAWVADAQQNSEYRLLIIQAQEAVAILPSEALRAKLLESNEVAYGNGFITGVDYRSHIPNWNNQLLHSHIAAAWQDSHTRRALEKEGA